MNANPSRELPTERPASFDESGNRVYLHPAKVKGYFREWRSRVYLILMVVFLGLPWLRVGGHQAILLDIPHRRFAIFGLTFWAHDAPMLVMVIGGFAVSLLFVTAVWGRVWCGWACPQTVFIDLFYRRIETWVEGDSRARAKLDAAPWSLQKGGKRTLKWILYVAVSMVITHSFLAYFVGTERLMQMVRTSPSESPISFVFMMATTGLILFDFGWFREQFCLIACPYGRLQSVLMDDRSLAPLYDEKRGEPRRERKAFVAGLGDCVNCYKCVQVCPTGIDIRRGLQMECIACTACIDACDNVMDAVGKPRGLIRYDSVTGMAGSKTSRFSFRSILYLAVMLIFAVSFIVTLSRRETLSISANRAPDSLFTALPGGKIVNHLRVHVANQDFADAEVQVAIEPEPFTVVIAKNPVPLAGGTFKLLDVFIEFPANALPEGKAKASLILTPNIPGHVSKPQRIAIDILGPVHNPK